MGQNFQHRALAWQRRSEVPQVQIQEVVRPKGTAVKVISQLWRFIKSAMKHGLSEYFEWRNQGFGGCLMLGMFRIPIQLLSLSLMGFPLPK
jgi:hypothetical protein